MSVPEQEPIGNGGRQQWAQWLLALTAMLFAGVILVPLLRSHPKSIHEFFSGVAPWQRKVCVLGLCVALAILFFRLFSPRLHHVRYTRSHPPIWLAWLVGLFFLGLADLTIGLSPGRYVASIWEWLGYCGGSVVLVASYVRLTTPAPERHDKRGERSGGDASAVPTDWPALEDWLTADAPARHDFLGNYAVAERLTAMLETSARSIGIVGPFGAGKTTIVERIRELVDNECERRPPELLFSQHSCWGFESSASAIHAMLADGIEKVAEYIDTFQVGSLPESYRQVFSAGGEWLDKVSRLIFRYRDPIQQFRALSHLLQEMGSRLVFIVEDLDRNDSQSFDIQDVLAFLHQLKDFPNLSFVLTGGLNAPTRIDFAKLCDHIEYVKAVGVRDSATIVCCLRSRCLDVDAFPHELLTPSDNNQWTYTDWEHLILADELRPPEAVARLLNTPRSMRHALGRTYRAWQVLVGEIDWDHLLAVNALRYAAPEAFSFVLRYWDRFRDQPAGSDREGPRVKRVRSALHEEWEKTVRDADWDAKAARALIDFILTATPSWLEADYQNETPRLQGVHLERYWQRALNEVLGPNEVSDQAVARDVHQWRELPSRESPLVVSLCNSEEYCTVWEHLAERYWRPSAREMMAPTQESLAKAEELLLLSEQVISHICKTHGSAASHYSQGFMSAWRVSNKCVPRTEGNQQWLTDRIAEAMPVSLALVNDLFFYWGSSQFSILRDDDRDEVRRRVLQLARQHLSTCAHLRAAVNPKHSHSLYQLVFAPGEDDRPTVHRDVESWAWLGPVLLEALRQGDRTIASESWALLSSLRAGGPDGQSSQVDRTVLSGFFGEDASEVVHLLGRMCGAPNEADHTSGVNGIESVASAQMSPSGESGRE